MAKIVLLAIFLYVSCIVATGNAQAVKDSKYLWKGGIVPYEISSGYSKSIYDSTIEFKIWLKFVLPFRIIYVAAEDKQILMEGINEYAKYTCIKLVPRTNQADYILFSEHSSG